MFLTKRRLTVEQRDGGIDTGRNEITGYWYLNKVAGTRVGGNLPPANVMRILSSSER